MPAVAKIVNNFRKRYGKKWKERYFAWEKANPVQLKKALVTARRNGDRIIASLSEKRPIKAKSHTFSRGNKVIYKPEK